MPRARQINAWQVCACLKQVGDAVGASRALIIIILYEALESYGMPA